MSEKKSAADVPKHGAAENYIYDPPETPSEVKILPPGQRQLEVGD